MGRLADGAVGVRSEDAEQRGVIVTVLWENQLAMNLPRLHLTFHPRQVLPSGRLRLPTSHFGSQSLKSS